MAPPDIDDTLAGADRALAEAAALAIFRFRPGLLSTLAAWIGGDDARGQTARLRERIARLADEVEGLRVAVAGALLPARLEMTA